MLSRANDVTVIGVDPWEFNDRKGANVTFVALPAPGSSEPPDSTGPFRCGLAEGVPLPVMGARIDVAFRLTNRALATRGEKVRDDSARTVPACVVESWSARK